MESNAKELGAKQMFDQSLVYLYNSYREDGLSADEASKLVTAEIEKTYQKYAEKGIAKANSPVMADPATLLGQSLDELQWFDWDKWRSMTAAQKEVEIKKLHQSIVRKIGVVKRLVK